MSSSSPRGRGAGMSTDDELVLILIGMAALGGLVGSVGVLWSKGLDWLLDHQVIVPAAAEPLLVLPGPGGAGLDVPRVALLAAVLLAALAVTVSAARRWVTSRGGDLA